MDTNGQTGNNSDTGNDKETLDEALAIADNDDASVTDEERDAEITEEVGTVLGDFA